MTKNTIKHTDKLDYAKLGYTDGLNGVPLRPLIALSDWWTPEAKEYKAAYAKGLKAWKRKKAYNKEKQGDR